MALMAQIVVALIGMIGFSFVLERAVLRPLLGRPVVAVIMATIGLAVNQVAAGLALTILGTGLSGLLAGRRGDSVIKAVKGVPNLFVLPVGISPPNPLELLQGPAFGLLLRELLTKFEHVIVDSPAGQYGADGIVIAARCGVSLVVARRDTSRIGSLQALVQNLGATGAQVAGVVMNEL